MTKIAYIHDRIVYPWWAEKIFSDLIDEHSKNTVIWRVFTLFSPDDSFHHLPVTTALPKRVNTFFNRTQKRKIPVLSGVFDYRNLMPFYPILCRLLQKKVEAFAPDSVIISSFSAVKNIVPPSWRDYKTMLYLHSPNQYIRENYNEYCTKLTGYKQVLFKACSRYLRSRDSLPRRYDSIRANSQYTKSIAIQKYWFDTTTVLVQYPRLPKAIYTYSPIPIPDNYFIFIWRLVTFVRELDRIIAFSNELQIPLLIMGDWPDREHLQAMAWPTITFLWHRSEPDQKYELLRRSRGLINITKESCGIVTMEALTLGVPVFGFNVGWTAELVTHKKNWRLVHSKEHNDLIKWFEKFQQITFERKAWSPTPVKVWSYNQE